MPTIRFILTQMGFVSLILISVSLMITLYLMREKSKSRATWLLIAFFAAVTANGVTMLATNSWVFWGDMFQPAQDAWILLGGVALAQFAYHFPINDQENEARWDLGITGAVALFATLYSIFYAMQFGFNYTSGLDENQAYYLLLPLMTVFIIGVFLRRAAHFIPTHNPGATRPSLGRNSIGLLLQPPTQQVRALRDFALALCLGLLPGVAFFVKLVPAIPGWIPSYMLSIGSVLAVSALALVYLNNSGAQTSFLGKIVGVFMVAFLLMFGAFGSWLISNVEIATGSGQITGLSPQIAVHRLIINLLAWALGSVVLLLVLFPLFLRHNLLEPLQALLTGVKLANPENLDIQVPVRYKDEIGYLTRAFNHLAASLQQSNRAREEAEAELKRRLDELCLSEEKFYKAFHSSPVMMILQKREDRTYLDVNAAFTEITGFSREEAVGRRPRELKLYSSPDEAERVAQAMQGANGQLSNFEFEFRRKSGELRTGLLWSEFFEVQGERTLLGIVMDISERKQAENEIRRLNAEMERRVAERSQALSAFLDLAFLVSQRESQEAPFIPALERIIEISSLNVVTIHTLSDDWRSLVMVAQVGLTDDEEDQMCALEPAGELAVWLSRPGPPLLLPDLTRQAILPECIVPPRLHSCLVCQLAAQEDVLGVMCCFFEDRHEFSLEEISLFVALGEHLGISLENQSLRRASEQAAAASERQRLARELHDSVTQTLYGLTLFTRSGQDALRTGNAAKLQSSLEQIGENANLALKEMRLLLYQMRPEALEGGFLQAVNARLDLVERRLGIQATFKVDARLSLPPDTEQALFRIALEALNNSLKHARASSVQVCLEPVLHGVALEVGDDGVGFDAGAVLADENLAGMGLRNMAARAAELDGHLEIQSTPGHGTRVRLEIESIPDIPPRSRR